MRKTYVNQREIALLASNIPNENTLELEDIPALFYLHLLNMGKGEETFDHIVVDEAQDFSPLYFTLLRQYSMNGSMTIVGDLSQGIYGYRGLSNWDEISALFDQSTLQKENIVQNYRSTQEIVGFTNQVLKTLWSDKAILAEPFARDGNKPQIIQLPNQLAMERAIVADVQSLLADHIQHIGLIVKNKADCQAISQSLGKLEPPLQVITDRDAAYNYQGGVVLLPVDLAKGIEFQVVLVLDASAEKYVTDYDGRLLYVALTRALHQLKVYSIGPLSHFLTTAKEYALFHKDSE